MDPLLFPWVQKALEYYIHVLEYTSRQVGQSLQKSTSGATTGFTGEFWKKGTRHM